jgi:uncharacterized membrane-anchored protein YhcB (DUF1043 family)
MSHSFIVALLLAAVIIFILGVAVGVIAARVIAGGGRSNDTAPDHRARLFVP